MSGFAAVRVTPIAIDDVMSTINRENLVAFFPYSFLTNMIFANLPRRQHRRLHDAGVAYHLWGSNLEGSDEDELLTCRLVCDWSIKPKEIDRFLALL